MPVPHLLGSSMPLQVLGAKANILSWEGDPNLDGSSSGSTNPERLSVTNQSGTTYILSGDGGPNREHCLTIPLFMTIPVSPL